MQQNQLEVMRAQLVREKQAADERLKILDHRLAAWQAEREHEMKMQELQLKYHQVASSEKVENMKAGNTPEREDAFMKVSQALLNAISFRRGQRLPPGGTPPALPS